MTWWQKFAVFNGGLSLLFYADDVFFGAVESGGIWAWQRAVVVVPVSIVNGFVCWHLVLKAWAEDKERRSRRAGSAA